MSAKSLEARVKKLEDIEEVKRVKNEYCYSVDERNWRAVLNLFATKSSADFGPFGKPKTKEEIRKFFTENIAKNFPFLVHNVHNALVEVNGDRAKGKWYFEVPATQAPDKAMWIMGRYDDDLVREKGGWKIRSMKCAFFYVTPYEKGWVKQKMPS